MSYHGWYSAGADKKFGHAVYTTPEGLEVKVTEAVSSADAKPGGLWNDFVYVGEIVQCVRSNPIKLDISPLELLNEIQEQIQEQKSCKAQFSGTGKCFCYTCPIKYARN